MAGSSSSSKYEGKILKRANPSTIQDKFLVGYQGWFTCPGDGAPVGPGHHGWLHWFDSPIPDGGHPNTDLWPDVSQYSPSELFPAPGLKTKNGEPVFLFSSRNAKTVQRHFHWMAEHGVDGVFLQRFAGQCDIERGDEGIRRIRDEVGDRVVEAAEREGRVFAIMYDVSGVAPDRIKKILEQDWGHLVRNKGVLDSPNYLREKGKPVIALWGFGFDNAEHTPELVHSITQFFRDTTPGGVYIMAGTPASWRTAEGDADPNPDFLNVWTSDFDAISPWTVGRYDNDQEADQFMEGKMKGDVELIKQHNEKGIGRKIDYIPVVLPGGSGYNMTQGQWGFNNIQRRGGRFLWKQISNAKRLGVRTMYGAMWDEYDEGTAFMPIVEHKSQLPVSDKFRFLALDEDGYDCPSDWYMRICGFAAEGIRGERQIHETFPVKELQDYWSSRPKFEEVSHKLGEFISGAMTGDAGGSGGSSGEGQGQTYQEWLSAQKEEKGGLPPPPYTLIEDDVAPLPTQAAVPVPIPAVPAANPTVHLPPSSSPRPPLAPQSARPTNGPERNDTAATAHITADAANPTHVRRQSQRQQQQPNHADAVGSITHDFTRVSVSGGPNTTPSTEGGVNYSARHDLPHSSVVPLHVVNADSRTASYPVQQSRPQSLSRPHSRPQSQSRPVQQQQPQQSPPHSPGLQSSYGAPVNRPGAGAVTPEQWPPASWNATPNRPSSVGPPQQSATSNSTVYGPATGGANLSRPNTFTASGYGASGPALQPPVNYHTRPPSQSVAAAPANSPWPSAHPSPNNINPRPTPPQPPNVYNNNSSFPQAGGYNPPRRQSSELVPNQDYNMPSFPDPSRSGYYPPYAGQSESTYPGKSSGSPYPPQANYSSWPSGPRMSPPPNPIGASMFPPPSTRPYSPTQSPYPQQYPGPGYSFNPSPPAMPGRPLGSDGFDAQVGGPQYQFPHATGGEGSYYGSNSSEMPSSTSFSPSYASRYDMPSSSYPGGGGGGQAQAYPPSEAWVPGSSASSPMPPLPPRPPTHYSGTQAKPPSTAGATSSAGSGALGYALNAVDKLAGRKTREQLESRVGSLTQMASNSKLFGKFTK